MDALMHLSEILARRPFVRTNLLHSLPEKGTKRLHAALPFLILARRCTLDPRLNMDTDDDIINRDKRIDVRVSTDEKKEIAARAAKAGLGVSEYVRRAALDHAVREMFSPAERAALIGIGRNLNQALAISHARKEVVPGVIEIVNKLKTIL